MLFAAVDIGSNTLRLLVADTNGGDLKPLKLDRAVTRLSRGLSETGLLDDSASALSIAVLKKFAKIVRNFNVNRIRCVGTSALREARNSAAFLALAKKETGLEIDVISGEEEAALTARGVLSAVTEPRPFVIVDIGGGSTELIYSDKPGHLGHLTEPVGVVKLLEGHIEQDPPSEAEIRALWDESSRFWSGLAGRIHASGSEGTLLIGTAGTACTLAAIDLGLETYDHEKVQGHQLDLKTLREMYEMLRRLPITDRARIRGLEPGRADLIIPGIILTISLMDTIGVNTIAISDRGLLEGIVLDMAGEV